MRRRLDVRQAELGNLVDRLEDGAQLLSEAVDLFVSQFQSREPSDMEHLVLRDRHEKDPSKTKRGPCGPRLEFETGPGLDGLDVRGLQALVALHDLERHALTLGQGAVALRLDRGVMDEDVIPVLALDEAVALLVRKPLHGALRQSFLLQQRTTARAPSRRTTALTAAP